MGEKSEVVIPLGGILDVTGEVIAMWAILALVLVLSLIATHNMKERPGTFQNMVEAGIGRVKRVKSGKTEPDKCDICDCCRHNRVLTSPISINDLTMNI